MKLFNIIGNLLGIGKDALNNRAKLKQLEAEQRFKITEATTNASVDRIISNTESDNQIDLITAQNKKYTFKDEIVTYLFLVPVIVATVVPFISAFESGQWNELNVLVKDSYLALNELPDWYKYILFAVVIDVLGFRSFARKIVDKYFIKK
jgi:hypothetical protein